MRFIGDAEQRIAGMLDAGGEYAWRVRGEEHMWTPDAIAKLQHGVRANRYEMLRNVIARGDGGVTNPPFEEQVRSEGTHLAKLRAHERLIHRDNVFGTPGFSSCKSTHSSVPDCSCWLMKKSMWARIGMPRI